MIHLTRRSVEECIMAAYGQYLLQRPGEIICATTDNGNVEISSTLNRGRFNCGFPGYNMDGNEIDNLRIWCRTHPGNGWSFGFRGINHDHPNNVNITLLGDVMFNFHVYLY